MTKSRLSTKEGKRPNETGSASRGLGARQRLPMSCRLEYGGRFYEVPLGLRHNLLLATNVSLEMRRVWRETGDGTWFREAQERQAALFREVETTCRVVA